MLVLDRWWWQVIAQGPPCTYCNSCTQLNMYSLEFKFNLNNNEQQITGNDDLTIEQLDTAVLENNSLLSQANIRPHKGERNLETFSSENDEWASQKQSLSAQKMHHWQWSRKTLKRVHKYLSLDNFESKSTPQLSRTNIPVEFTDSLVLADNRGGTHLNLKTTPCVWNPRLHLSREAISWHWVQIPKANNNKQGAFPGGHKLEVYTQATPYIQDLSIHKLVKVHVQAHVKPLPKKQTMLSFQ